MLHHVNSLEKLDLFDCPQIKFLLTNQPTEREVTSSLASAEITSAGDEQLLQIPCSLLHSLKWLSISECPDLEFCGGSGGFAGFTSLVQLQIKNCPKLVSALVSETNDNGLLPMSLQDLSLSPLSVSENLQSFSPEGLPCLRRLSLCRSQHLKSMQLHSCTSLEYLKISGCRSLVVLEGLSSLRRLDIQMNPELSAAWHLKLQEQEQGGNQAQVFPPSLVELHISNLEGSISSQFLCLPSVTKLAVRDSPALKSIQLKHCMTLEKLEIINCKLLASIEDFHSIRNLRSLKVLGTRSLSPYLQQEASGMWFRLESLMIDDAAVLSVHLCIQLTSLRILQFWSMGMASLTEEQERALQLLTSLRQLGFSRCQKLESLPANLRSLDFLEVLRIDECRSIRRLPEMGLPPSLSYLDLYGCCEELCMQGRMAETEKLKVEIIYKQ